MKQGRYEWKAGRPVYVSSRIVCSEKEEGVIGACALILLVLAFFFFA